MPASGENIFLLAARMRYNASMEFHAEKEQFKNPEEEIAYLKEELARREGALGRAPRASEREHLAKETIAAYQKAAPEKVLADSFRMPEHETEGIALRLSPERHDTVMEELLGHLQTEGIKNAFGIAEKLGNPHVMDDFHRFLVQYLAAAGSIRGLSEREPLYRSLDMRLYQIALPKFTEKNDQDRAKALKDILSAMEQFYAGMMSVSDGGIAGAGKNYFTIEIALPHIGSEVSFYVGVPSRKSDLLAKQVQAVFPDAKIDEMPDDYNIFNDTGASVGASAESLRSPVFPLKMYDEFDTDPLNVILNAFSKIAHEGEGAAIQIVVAPAGSYFVKKYGHALEEVRKGVPTKHAINVPEGIGGEIIKTVKKEIFGIGAVKKKKNQDASEKLIDDSAVEQIKKKIGSTIVNTNIRVIASAKDETRAQAILSDIEAAFNQFTNAQGNGIVWKYEKGRAALALFKEFSYRAWNEGDGFPLNLMELSTILHFPVKETESPILKVAKAGTASAPLDLPRDGVLLGVNRYRGKETPIYFSDSDRLRHFYVIGQTGTGKTVTCKNMIIQDIQAGRGVCMIDPHGSDIQDILANIPKERLDDVIYFDPGYTARPMGLNMLEFDPRYPEQKTLIVDELFGIFKKLYGAIPESMGPAFEQYFRGGALLVMEHPESGSTLMEILRVLSDKKFRDLKLSHTKNPQLIMFWQNAEKTSGEQGLANYVPYVTSKFDIFTQNEIMRPIIAQEKSAFNMRDVMDNRKILLVNLSKGRLGDINSNLIGLIIVGKILMAALSRVDSIGKNLPPFYLYLDEFQNITTPSIATILSEARKYGVSLNIAHQFIDQLDEEIRDAVFGNVGSMAVFRVGAKDAEFLVKQFEPVFSERDLISVDNFNAYVRMLANNKPTLPFSMETYPSPKGNPAVVEKIKELSYLKYGRPRAEVEEEILARFRSI